MTLLSLFLLTSCLTSRVDLQDLPDYREQYEQVENYEDLVIVQTGHIIDLRAEIYRLWTYILKSDKNKITVFDLRSEETKEKYEEYIKEGN